MRSSSGSLLATRSRLTLPASRHVLGVRHATDPGVSQSVSAKGEEEEGAHHTQEH